MKVVNSKCLSWLNLLYFQTCARCKSHSLARSSFEFTNRGDALQLEEFRLRVRTSSHLDDQAKGDEEVENGDRPGDFDMGNYKGRRWNEGAANAGMVSYKTRKGRT